MRAPIHSQPTRSHQQPAWLQIGMALVGGVALGLLVLQVLAGHDHGFIVTHDALFQAPVALHLPVTR